MNLPHDGMIGTPVSPDAPARSDMGYFTGGLSSYTKYVTIPREWGKGCVGLQIDGAMMNAAVEINGCKAAVLPSVPPVSAARQNSVIHQNFEADQIGMSAD